jgi:hypothetical protein
MGFLLPGLLISILFSAFEAVLAISLRDFNVSCATLIRWAVITLLKSEGYHFFASRTFMSLP